MAVETVEDIAEDVVLSYKRVVNQESRGKEGMMDRRGQEEETPKEKIK